MKKIKKKERNKEEIEGKVTKCIWITSMYLYGYQNHLLAIIKTKQRWIVNDKLNKA